MLAKISQAVEAIAVLRVLVGLVEPIKQLIEIVEDIFSGESEAGPEKKAMVIEILLLGVDAIERAFKLELPKQTIVDFADNIIDILVRAFNIFGIFRRSQEAKEETGPEPHVDPTLGKLE